MHEQRIFIGADMLWIRTRPWATEYSWWRHGRRVEVWEG